ncbi:MAG: Na+/H+ antiporter NhaC family protein [Lachnospiraceae bacterium]|nr:Na+/H+ antiporter NhaC family protein [Lachnospiraceae bacterium]
MNKVRPNPKALFPILVFLVLYLGGGIYFEYISPEEGRMGFYVMSVVVSFGLALIVAFLQNKSLSFDEKVSICAKGIGDDNIVIMLYIFLMAGAFSGLAKEAGGAASTANLMLDILPGSFAIPGMFLIACLISMAMGTSVGTISVIVPIAAEIAKNTNFNMAVITAAVVGGAMFGDNLSVISDTTIAATRTQGVEMRDKFRTNIKIAIPAAIATLVILVIYTMRNPGAALEHYDFNIFLAMPYFIVLILAVVGLNVFFVLGLGIILFLVIGIAAGTISFSAAFSAMGTGTNGMFETMIVTILVASISSLIKAHGGFEAVLDFIRRHAKSARGGKLGICLLTALMDISTANNTVAIVIAAPIAKDISEEYGIEPKVTASLLDTCSCVFQGIIPYGAQLLVAASIAQISSISIIPHLYYPFLLAVCMLISILFGRKK